MKICVLLADIRSIKSFGYNHARKMCSMFSVSMSNIIGNLRFSVAKSNVVDDFSIQNNTKSNRQKHTSNARLA